MGTAVIERPAESVDVAELYRLTTKQYDRMVEVGIIGEHDAVELVDGLLFDKHVIARRSAAGTVDWEELFSLSVAQYDAMGRSEIVTSDDRVELVEGVLFKHMTIYPPHTGTVQRCRSRIEAVLPGGWRYRSEQPIVLPHGEPEPDGVIARGEPADDFLFHPPAADVALVIEVADSTLIRDRGPKLRGYARASIPIYWLINLPGRQIEVYTGPDPASVPRPTYRHRTLLVPGMDIAVPVAGVSLAVADLLPPA